MSGGQTSTLQGVIFDLQRYWASQGCVIWQPYNSQVGAGTMNPATFLRVLGPEPWRVGYVEPSVRPADARYGQNPNRLGTHYQFQVILKPDPGNPQELYLSSLEALGVDPRQHDIRFVEDNWEAPTVGAWGLGWEVWLDGQEITQFTYFQQAGGIPLDPVSVEMTYGLERIVMALQGARHFAEIPWSPEYSYGDLQLQAEQEHSTYFFRTADVERLRSLFEEYQAEAQASLQSGLVLPAYDYLLKCSHTFNLLDSRGAVGVTERAGLFGQMRQLANGVALAYLDQRKALNHPWLDRRELVSPEIQASPQAGAAGSKGYAINAGKQRARAPAAAPFLLEIGVEELPAADLSAALDQLQQTLPAMLEAERLEFRDLEVMGTPRRIVAHVASLAAHQSDEILQRKGPPAKQAFDHDGKPTQAAIGFAGSSGVEVGSLRVQQIEGGEYVVAEVRSAGRPTPEVLSERLPELIQELRFDRGMRWDGGGVSFSRPIRWLLALYGELVVPFSYAGLTSGRGSRGLRFTQPASLQASRPGDYFKKLERQGILLAVTQREAEIWQQVQQLAAEVGGQVSRDEQLLREVTNLVEAPTALRGSFEQQFLQLPREVLESVMKSHQRYFPIERRGRLLPYFIAVRNGGPAGVEQVVRGNEQVIAARFADAAYFVEQDRQRPLESYRGELDRLIFHTELGSMLAKLQRIESLVSRLADRFRLPDGDRQIALRAAHLCKADLATSMVIEMTSLQGIMGREYARASGEPSQVAQAIYEHYLPRHTGDALPESLPSLVLGLADRLDTLMGLFAVGMQPSGASDPYALRRSALGLIQLLTGKELRFDLRQGLAWSAAGLPLEVTPEASQRCLEFIVARQQGLLRAEGHRHDVVEAVLAEQGHDPAGAADAVQALGRWVRSEAWLELLQAYARCARITRDQVERHAVEPGQLEEPASKALFKALQKAEKARRQAGSVDDFLNAFRPMIPAINRFFDEVLVMSEDERLRRLRLGMLQRIVSLATGVADLARLEGF